jgi:hypothetical protein
MGLPLKARKEGLIASFDDLALRYVPELAGILYGQTASST